MWSGKWWSSIQPSQHACILLGYLSVDKISQANLTIREHQNCIQRLFHQSMRIILSPLIKAGKEGVKMTSADGKIRQIHPILACYVANFPEQCLVACAKYGTCAKCQTHADHLQYIGSETSPLHTPKWTQNVISTAQKMSSTAKVSGSIHTPFWSGFPFTDIHMSMTPDVLHQLYQGVFKHLNGISALAQITGMEHKNMAKILLGCLIGALPENGILAVKSILDFIYLAQYTTHDDTTLQYKDDALHKWDEY
ncbi:hypothetical protein BDZ94DRAFT_1284869 [Collybia nuda]|uniref:Uncharacterized protein n=1 Tax=Collybia nuda TaxID=64659 RepID=A0A9P5XZ21_9AGAR|nr:hypothetical protein BDZ94DRAFT_1284869 [Collybia nuda]